MTKTGKLDAKHFLKHYWQKKPYLIRNSFPDSYNLVSGEELAGLACEQGVEARVIFANPGQSEWTCEFAPFDETHFTSLDDKNWTLLVQAVDQYFPEAHALLDNFNFLPRWRLDDVMMSYATPGGGVGPHFDYYDVFLIQTSGSREWKIGQPCDSTTQLRSHEDLKLLESFIESETHVLKQGDMIYIPAGLAHWGTALSDDCITASIGFRAPSHKELLQGAIENISNEFKDEQRYKDSVINPNDDKFLIDESVNNQLELIWNQLDKNQFINSLSEQLSVQVTEVRDEDVFEPADYSMTEITSLTLKHHPASRFAYRKNAETNGGTNDVTIEKTILYVNGYSYPTNYATAHGICHSDYTNTKELDWELILDLVNQGFIIE